MAAGASILDGVHKNKWTLNVQGRRRGGMGAVAEMLGGELVDDDDYEIEKRKDKLEADTDPNLLIVPPDRKREREIERQEFRQERKKVKKQVPIKEEKPEKKIELNPLLKIKSKDGSVVFDGSSGGDGTIALDGSTETDRTVTVTTPEVEKPPRELNASVASKAEEPSSLRLADVGPAAPTKASTAAAAPTAPAAPAAPTAAPAARTGGLLGSLGYDDSSSDADEPVGTSSYNYLNLSAQATSPAKFGRPIAETQLKDKVLPQQQTPLWQSLRSPAPTVSSASAPAQVVKPPAKAPAKAIVPGLDTSMKEVSPALAALMSGLDC